MLLEAGSKGKVLVSDLLHLLIEEVAVGYQGMREPQWSGCAVSARAASILTSIVLGPNLSPSSVGSLVGQPVVEDKFVEGLVELNLSSIGSAVVLLGLGDDAPTVTSLHLKVGQHLTGRGRSSGEGGVRCMDHLVMVSIPQLQL